MRHSHSKKTRHILILLVTFITLCHTAGLYAGGTEGRRLIFLGTADLQGKLDPAVRSIDLNHDGNKISVAGGIARIAETLDKIQGEAQAPVVVISSGDDLMGSYFHFYDGKAIVKLLGMAGYNILGLGNHEFDRGPGILGEALEQTDFTTLCSDLKVTGTALENACEPYLIRTYDSVSVGFFSLMTEEFPFVTSGGNVHLQDDNVTAAKNMVTILNQKGADIIVAVTHVGVKQDRHLAAQVKGIDVIFGGHSHDYLPEYEQIGNTLIVNGGEKGAALVYLDISLTPDNRIQKDSIRFKLIPITEDIAEKKEVSEMLAAYKNKMPDAVVLGSTETTWDLSKSSIRSGESTVADLINDLIREKFNVDIVLNNGGAFRGNKEYPPGKVTDKMLHEIDEFENDVYLLKIKGKYLKEILEHSASQIGQGGFLQASGLHFVINLPEQPQEITDQNGTWSVTRTGKRITDVSVAAEDGSYQALDSEKIYSVACNAYLAEREGDKYYWFKQYGQDHVNTYTTLSSVLAEEFSKKKVINTPQPDGRVTVIK